MTARVQAKVERFLSTSPLTRVKHFCIKVHKLNSEAHRQARRYVSRILYRIKQKVIGNMIFVKSKISITQGKQQTLARCIPFHIQHSLAIQCSALPPITPCVQKWFDDRKDVWIEMNNWETPIEPPHHQI